MGLAQAVSMARTEIAESGIEGWIHLDHSDSFELAQRCIDAGFDSVMIDASEYPIEKNIEITQRVVEIAHIHGVIPVNTIFLKKSILFFPVPGELSVRF